MLKLSGLAICVLVAVALADCVNDWKVLCANADYQKSKEYDETACIPALLKKTCMDIE